MSTAVLALALPILLIGELVNAENKGLVTIGGHEYFISDSERLIWPNASDACIARGMILLTLTSQSKNDEIMAYFRANGMGLTSYWTGGQKTSGGFEWSGINKPFTFTDWAMGQPDEPTNDAYVDFNAVDGWFDMPASLRIHYVCE